MRSLLPALLSLLLAWPAVADAAPARKAQVTKKSSTHKVRAGAKSSAIKRSKQATARKSSTRHADADGEQVNFGEWQAVREFVDEVALRHGFPRDELTALIAKVRYVDAAVRLVKPGPPGKPKNMNAVRALNIEPIRIAAGVRFWNEHADVLAQAEREFGVAAEIIVGIVGIETIYGRNTGRFRVLDVLTTLAFAYPEASNRSARMAFFRSELENALVLARKNSVDPVSLLGSFAGAIGMPQFMPGSVLAYGVDYDHDHAVDLRGSPVDVIGSVANFLVQHGWQREQTGPLVFAANVSPGMAWTRFLSQGLEARFSAAELAASGAVTTSAAPADRLYGLLDLQNGENGTEYWWATANFFAITKYNRSYYYAMSVVELGRAVKLARANSGLMPAETL